MTSLTTKWFRLLFKLKLYEASGEEFQRVVAAVYKAANSGFQSVAPWGPEGDSGNDGWIPSEGHYLQVYGPKASSTWRPNDAARKASDDFRKLLNDWEDIRCYSFVLNDRFEGIPAPVLRTLQDIEKQRGIRARAVGAGDICDMFMNLKEEKQEEIVGSVPDITKTDGAIDPSALGEVLQWLADKDFQMYGSARSLAPDFDEKIIFNGLSDEIADHLRWCSYQVHELDNFLSTRDQWLAQAIADELSERYRQSEKEPFSGDSEGAGMRYIWMIDQIVPLSAHRHPHTLKAYRQAAGVVMAKYFESCHVFKSPINDSAA